MNPALLLALVIATLSGCKTSDIQRPEMPEGSRAISIAVNLDSSNGVRPKDKVDLFTGSQLLCSNVVVLDVRKVFPEQWNSVTLQLTEEQTEQLVSAQQQPKGFSVKKHSPR